jgi:arginyl-tRNA synthetase
VRDFAARFHGFYRDCRVISDDAASTQARLWLGEACRIGLAAALAILGVGAPEEMARRADAPDGASGASGAHGASDDGVNADLGGPS